MKSLYQRYLRAEPSHRLRATSVSSFAFSSINRQQNNLIALIKALVAVPAFLDYGQFLVYSKI